MRTYVRVFIVMLMMLVGALFISRPSGWLRLARDADPDPPGVVVEWSPRAAPVFVSGQAASLRGFDRSAWLNLGQ